MEVFTFLPWHYFEHNQCIELLGNKVIGQEGDQIGLCSSCTLTSCPLCLHGLCSLGPSWDWLSTLCSLTCSHFHVSLDLSRMPLLLAFMWLNVHEKGLSPGCVTLLERRPLHQKSEGSIFGQGLIPGQGVHRSQPINVSTHPPLSLPSSLK